MDSDEENVQGFQDEAILEKREQAYDKVKTKVEILDVKFHPTHSQIVTIGLMNGKIKM